MVEIKVVRVKQVSTGEIRDRVSVSCPFNPEFVAEAHKLNGKWYDGIKPAWRFDPRDETRIHEICKKIYGTDGQGPVVTMDIQIHLDRYHTNEAQLFTCGRQVAWRPGRDASVRLGNDVVIVAGGFNSSGGSAKYPTLSPKLGTVLEIRDVPMELAEKEIDGKACFKVISTNQERSEKEAENFHKQD